MTRRGNDVVFAIDTSRSMLTQDVKPNRLTRAKLAIDDVTGQLDGDAVGIVAFAGSAFLVCPITLDYDAFHESLNAVDTNTIARGGTNISSAIRASQAALRRRPGSDKILILLTDGEDLEGEALTAAQNAAKQDALKIFTVGVGTAAGELIPVPSEQGGGFVKDEKGALVKSRLDEAALKAIASVTGGGYISLESPADGLEETRWKALTLIAKHDLASRSQKIYSQRFQWPLSASLLLLLGSLVLGLRRNVARNGPAARVVVLILLTATLVSVRTLHAADNDIRQPIQQYNAGTTAYRAGQFPTATRAFQHSISQAPSSDAERLAEQEDAYYNLGNTQYRSGQQTEKSAPQETRQKWQYAIKAYDTALQLRPGDEDSRYNRDLVKRKLDELNHESPPPIPNQKPPPNSNSRPAPSATPTGKTPAGTPPPFESQRDPVQMSGEEAQQLLDSAKSDERIGTKAPGDRHDRDQQPNRPFKNW